MIRRDRLFNRIDDARRVPALWVAASPGAGKTTLIVDYLQTRDVPFAWLQADAEDGDAATFCHFLKLAVAHLPGVTNAKLPRFGTDGRNNPTDFLRRWFRQVFRGQGIVLVIDNFQEIPAASPVRAALAEVITEVPAGDNVVLVSREEPGEEFTHAIAAGQIARMGWNDLQLTVDEAASLAGARDIASGAIARMHAACDGWSAGMVLMLARFDRTGIVNEPVPGDASMDLVFRYFAGLLFDDATPSARRGLCLAALLPRMTADEATAQTQDPSIVGVLESMHSRHLFVTRRYLPESTFEMHALLRQFLVSRAPAVLDHETLTAGMYRAARHLEARGDGSAALALYLEMGDLTEAERTVIAFADEWLEQGRHRTIRDAIASLPPSLVVASAALSMYAGLGAMPFDQQEARRRLGDAFRSFSSAKDHAGQVRSACGVIDTYAGNFTDFGSIAAWLDTLCVLIDDPRFAALPDAVRLEAAGAFVFAGLYGRPGHEQLRPMAERLRGMLIDTRVADEQRLRVGTWFLSFCDASEDTRFANAVVSVLDAISRQPGVSPLRRMWWLLRLGFHRYLEGDLDGAHASLSTLRELSEEEDFHAADGLMDMWDAFIRAAMPLARGRSMKVLLPHWRGSLAPDRLPDHTYAAIAELAERVTTAPDDPAAVVLARTTVDLSDRIKLDWIRISFRIPLGLALARFGHFDEARACADTIRTRARGTCFASYVDDADGIDAYCCILRGQPRDGAEALRRWVSTAMNRTLWYRWYKAPCVSLLRHAIASGIEAPTALALIARYWPDDQPAATPVPNIAIQLLGGFAITRDGIAVSLGTRAPRRLLDLLRALAIVGNPWVSTAWLMDEFWPESDGDQARRALAVALHRLRRLLGDPEAVETSEQQVRLNPDRVVTDLSQARARLQACLPASGVLNDGWAEDVADALASYGGPLLPGYEAAWIIAERTRLERLAERLRSIMADIDATSALAIRSTLSARPPSSTVEMAPLSPAPGPGTDPDDTAFP